MTNLQKLKKAIIKEIPELEELRIGTKLINKDVGGAHSLIVNKRAWEDTFSVWGWDGWFDSIWVKENYKISNTITLANILKVLGSLNKNYGDHNVTVNCGRYHFSNKESNKEYYHIETKGNPFFAKWNLSKNLDDQSKETIDFLTDIICKKDE